MPPEINRPVARVDLASALAGMQRTGNPILYDSSGQRIASREVFESRFPSPGPPLRTTEPTGKAPRVWFPYPGYNLSYQPRTEAGEALTAFDSLRRMADICSLLRAVIEDSKQQILGLSWDIHTEDDVSQAKTSEIATVKAFMKRPDGTHDFRTWLAILLEEMNVTDATTVYRHRSNDGSPKAMRLIDGAKIKPLVDWAGDTPAPPSPAYQQIIMGRPETEFTRPWGDAQPFASECYNCGASATGTEGPDCDVCGKDDGLAKIEVCYHLRHPRIHSAYGRPPVEDVIMIVNILLRSEVHSLTYYTRGTVPDALYKVPEDWTTQQIAEYQAMFTEMTEGDSGIRHQLKFVPGGPNTGLEDPRKGDQWQYEFWEFLGRVIAWRFHTSPLPLAKQVNRASAESMDRGETDSGLKPDLGFVCDLITEHIREFLGFDGLKFMFIDEKQESVQSKIDGWIACVKEGVLSRSEVRDELGLEETPQDGSPLLVDTASGPVKVPTAEDLAAQDAAAAAPAAPGAPIHPALAAVPPIPAGQPSGVHPALRAVPPLPAAVPRPPTPGGATGASTPPAPGAAGAVGKAAGNPHHAHDGKFTDEQRGRATQRLREARQKVLDLIAELEGKPNGKFVSNEDFQDALLKAGTAALDDLRRWKKVALKAVKAKKPVREFKTETVNPVMKQALSEWLATAKTEEDVAWAFRSLIKARRPLVSARRRIRLEKRLRDAALAHFKARAIHLGTLLGKTYPHPSMKVAKADGPTDEQIDEAMAWDTFLDASEGSLSDAYLEAENLAGDIGGIEASYGLTSEAAVEYAKVRGAELVGKKIVDGVAVDNPNAKWSVPKTVRDDVRQALAYAMENGLSEDDFRKSIEDETFWNWRADMIARTEIATALNSGAAAVYRDAGVDEVEIYDGDGCLEDGHDDSEPGVNGERWSLEKFEEFPIGHPNCRRDGIPIVVTDVNAEDEEGEE